MCFFDDRSDEDVMRQRIPEYDEYRAQKEAGEARRNLLPPAPDPFAVFGPRIGVKRISDVRPGERGRMVSVSDLKIGL